MRVSEMFPSEFMKVKDVPKTGLSVTIKSVTPGSIKDRESGELKRTWVLSFSDNPKRLTLNKGNALAIEKAYGDSDNWPGNLITLVRVHGLSFGKMSWLIRVATPDDDEPDDELDDELDDASLAGVNEEIPF